MPAGTAKHLYGAQDKVSGSGVLEGVQTHKSSSEVDALPEVEGSAVSEGFTGHLLASGVSEGNCERVDESSGPALGQ